LFFFLKVNGQEVRSEKHPTVVSLIKGEIFEIFLLTLFNFIFVTLIFVASTLVELAVKRSQKCLRPNSVNVVPSTPILSSRDRTASITGPQPVDVITSQLQF